MNKEPSFHTSLVVQRFTVWMWSAFSHELQSMTKVRPRLVELCIRSIYIKLENLLDAKAWFSKYFEIHATECSRFWSLMACREQTSRCSRLSNALISEETVPYLLRLHSSQHIGSFLRNIQNTKTSREMASGRDRLPSHYPISQIHARAGWNVRSVSNPARASY